MPGPGYPTLFKPAERNAARRGGPAGRPRRTNGGVRPTRQRKPAAEREEALNPSENGGPFDGGATWVKTGGNSLQGLCSVTSAVHSIGESLAEIAGIAEIEPDTAVPASPPLSFCRSIRCPG
jgi:hypothetical protein